MSLYGADKLLSPMVNAVLSRNLASTSRWASEKCQNETEEAHALSEVGCMSADDISSELRIVADKSADIEIGENGVRRDSGQNPVPVAGSVFGCGETDGSTTSTQAGASKSTTFSSGPSRTWNDP
jgi:hypothetical protein